MVETGGVDRIMLDNMKPDTMREALAIIDGRFLSEGLIAPVGNSRIRATPSGMIVLDALVADLAR